MSFSLVFAYFEFLNEREMKKGIEAMKTNVEKKPGKSSCVLK